MNTYPDIELVRAIAAEYGTQPPLNSTLTNAFRAGFKRGWAQALEPVVGPAPGVDSPKKTEEWELAFQEAYRPLTLGLLSPEALIFKQGFNHQRWASWKITPVTGTSTTWREADRIAYNLGLQFALKVQAREVAQPISAVPALLIPLVGETWHFALSNASHCLTGKVTDITERTVEIQTGNNIVSRYPKSKVEFLDKVEVKPNPADASSWKCQYALRGSDWQDCSEALYDALKASLSSKVSVRRVGPGHCDN